MIFRLYLPDCHWTVHKETPEPPGQIILQPGPPVFNIKGRRGAKKAYSKVEKQKSRANAYKHWTAIDDEKLEQLYCEGNSATEISKIFNRNTGAIRSRIKKLELRDKCGK